MNTATDRPEAGSPQEDTYTARYVDAVTRALPQAQRADVAAELRASIEDQYEARVEAGEDPDAAELAVLRELGDPDRLAADYLERPLHLLGPTYYLAWKRLLRLLLCIVVPLAAFGVTLGQTLDGASFGSVAGAVVSTSLAVVVHLTFWTTLVFVLVERKARPGADELAPWDPESLSPRQESGTGLGELVVQLLLLALAAGAVLWDHVRGAYEGVSFLEPSLWPWWTAALFVLLAAEAVIAVSAYARGRWTRPLAVANLLVAAALAAGVAWLTAQDRLLNPELFPLLMGADEAAHVTTVLTVVIGVGVVTSCAWEAYDGLRKARRP